MDEVIARDLHRGSSRNLDQWQIGRTDPMLRDGHWLVGWCFELEYDAVVPLVRAHSNISDIRDLAPDVRAERQANAHEVGGRRGRGGARGGG